ncbi:MAG: hypothetical protein KAI55_00565, partial [Candidatus Aenigmarchaeota archaeon]|nr:hypothetical protein [Candidatus Aenigmarchaeota archaeon]
KLNVYGKEKFTFAVKKPISEKIIKKKEYLLMLEFKKFLPDNLPKVYDWDEEYQMIIMEEIKGRELVKIPKEEFFKNPQLIAKLGEIIAVMHNNNFIHGDPHGGNIMLDEKNIWKLIDFGASHHLGKGVDKITAKLFEYFLIKLKALNTRGLSDKRIVSQFYPTYFINRNYRDTVSYLIKKKDSKALNGLFDVVEFVVENIDSHSQQVDKCLSGLIFQMYDLIQKHCPKNEKFKSIVDDFKNKISKNPNINLRISDEESMSIHSDEERLEKPIDSEGVGNLMDKDGFPVSDQNPSQLTPVEKEAKEAITNLKKTIEELSNALNEERNHEEINAEENTPQ